MFKDLIQKWKKNPLDDEIDRVLTKLHSMSVDHEDYPKTLTYFERLNQVKEKSSGSPLSRDAIVSVAGSLLGILLIVGYEKHNVVTSKGFNFLPKAR